MKDIDLSDIIAHVYWTAFDNGRLLGKDKSPNLRDFKLSASIVDEAMLKVRRLARADKKKANK